MRKIELCSFISDSAVILAIAVSKRCTRDLPVVNAQDFVYLPFGHSRKKFSKPSFSLLTLGYHFRSTSFLLFGRVKRVARARYPPPPPLFVPRFRVSSRVPLVRLLFTISPKGRACSQAKNLWNKTPCPLRLVSFVDWKISKHM